MNRDGSRSTTHGTHPWQLSRGATLRPDGSAHFAIWAPRAGALGVHVRSGSAAGMHRLEQSTQVSGLHEGLVAGVGAGADYAIVLADGREVPDPVSRWQPDGVHGASRLVDPDAYAWDDTAWQGIPLVDYIIYEMHVGTFTRAGTFDAAVAELARLATLGITAIEIMPVAQFPGERNWGYDGVHLYAVQNSYGGPAGLKRLVDAAHAHGLAVILDVVYNHVGPEGNYLDAFGPYFTDKYATPWGRAINYDDAECAEVRRFVIDNARYWVSEYHVDALRLDAVHAMFDFGATHLLQELTQAVNAVGEQAGRKVHVIAESDLNDPRLVRPVEQGGYALDAQWSDDFHHAVHALLTGEASGYYEDFGGVAMVAEALRQPFVYAGGYSRYRRRAHGGPSTGIAREKFVVAIQNHDQVGNRLAGDRLCTLISPAKLRVAAALLLLSPYVPLLFMGEEYGETNPFLYFISHSDEELVAAVRDGRRSEFAAFDLGDAVPDPQDPATFERSKIDTAKSVRQPHAGILALYRDLLAIRRAHRELRPDGARSEVESGDGWIRLLRVGGQGTVDGSTPTEFMMVHNLSDMEHSVRLAGGPRDWQLRLSTDAAVYGGRDMLRAEADQLTVPPWSAVLMHR